MALLGSRYVYSLALACLVSLLPETSSEQQSSKGSEPIVFLRAGAIRLDKPAGWNLRNTRKLLATDIPMQDPRWGVLMGAHQILASIKPPLSAAYLEDLDSALLGRGGMLSSFIPEESLLVVANEDAATYLSQAESIVGMGMFLPEFKYGPEWKSYLSPDARNGSCATSPSGSSSAQSGELPASVQAEVIGTHLLSYVDVYFPSQMFRERVSMSPSAPAEHVYDPAAAALEDWQVPVSELCSSSPVRVSLLREGSLQLLAKIPSGCFCEVVHWLSLQPAVHWLAPRLRIKTHNYQGVTILQTGQAAPSDNRRWADIRPLWAAGLNGTGQIIGCGDSGIDVKSCYFYDPSVEVLPGSELDSGGKMYFSSTSHRKVAYYRFFGDGVDDNGHGTHVTASVAGSTSQGSWSDNNGMAPGAKLAFTDLGRTGHNGGIGVPGNLSRDYFPFAWNFGARIFSESWGSDSATYDGLAQGVDEMSWENPEFLAIIAAGNFGGLEKDANINSPGTSKNSITVGATLTAESPSIAQVPVVRDGDVFRITATGGLPGDGAHGDEYTVQLAHFGPTFGDFFLGSSFELAMASPLDACSTITNAAEIIGKLALVERGQCEFIDKVYRLQQAGAVAALVANNGPSGSFKMTFAGSVKSVESVLIPTASIPRNAARPMFRALEAGRQLLIRIGPQRLPEDRFSNLAPFSSIGPTSDGRIKPDVVAPGVTVSAGIAKRPDECVRSVLHGTSMATPLVGGGAAIVRQYFLEGWYPTGSVNENNAYTPSGALVKAVIIAGATSMLGTTPSDNPDLNGVPLEPPPSIRQGFGRANIGTSLPLQGAGWNLQVVDQVPMSTGQKHTYCITALGGWLKVVLVWHDPPSDLAASKNLVNDLNLYVRSSGLGGHKILGNGDRDDTNNVEMVSFGNMPPGTVAITVEGFQVPQAAQPYAMVLLGQFEGKLQGGHNPDKHAGAPEACTVVAAKIYIGPQMLSNNSHPTFSFGSTQGYPSDFECRLKLVSSEVVSEPGHPWRPCISPLSYRGLPDGRYEFAVRGKDETELAAYIFSIDTKPPVTTIDSTPATLSIVPSARIQFSATDLSPVHFQCLLRPDASDADPLNGSQNASFWQPCTSPFQINGLHPAVWTFSVRAFDDAGNMDPGLPVSTAWRYDPDTSKVYAVITSGPQGPTTSRAPSFSFGLARQYNQQIMGSGFECLLEVFRNNSAEILRSWSPCTAPHAPGFLPDGEFRFSVRSASNGGRGSSSTAAQARFSIDTTPPVLRILSAPSAMQTGSVASFEFESNEPGTKLSCSLVELSGPSTGSYPPAPCTSSRAFLNLADGQYLFVLDGMDPAGNSASPVTHTWSVDATPPNLVAFDAAGGTHNEAVHLYDGTVTAPQLSSAGHVLTLLWQLSDGEYGTGIDSVFCFMDPIQMESSEQLPDAPLFQGIVGGHKQGVLCNSPQDYWLAEGNYSFALSAFDKAHNSATLVQINIVIDLQPPVSGTRFFHEAGKPVASSVLLMVEAIDMGVAPSGVQRLWGLLRSLSAEEFNSYQPSSVDPVAPALHLGGGAVETGTLLSETPGTNESQTQVLLRGAGAVLLDRWHMLVYAQQLSPVVYEGLPSGLYVFRALAADNAGNVGQQADAVLFEVDSSLPIPNIDDMLSEASNGEVGSSAVSSISTATKVAIPIVCSGALILFAAFGLWRYRLHNEQQRRQRFIALQSSDTVVQSSPEHRDSPGSNLRRRPQAASQRALDVGPWKVQLNWAPIMPMDDDY
mmetsp:Transcript_31546/g.89554  ORF Transcript_31546/g.89554 Transcript_31546/m.89554 type:complete len:1752 (-) Transcript_31546:144-5399(-)|eukprot:CAMPEP_0117680196 /NCGR_PEP_ID=MMETSP0804-20121206/18215_1 /TAXON_ID=1074897 /ORGANISM="Tetraselmis astigmatica, Strain CCMP880" /LENGTH=1751 /DNA_ID=CAMNT_0005489661 /DNA_START=222 /DNA_END=5477 /DNA_ORIENTATION=+